MKRISEIVVMVLFGGMVLCGCDWNPSGRGRGLEVANEPAPSSGQAYINKTAIQDETGTGSNNAVDAAMEWAKKYAEVSSRYDQLLQENRRIKQKQQTHQQQVTKLQFELKQAETELAQANTMLVEMRTELEKWKKNVLGFRDEIRHSQKAQLDALVRILTLIGGEVVEKSPKTQPAKKTSTISREKTGGAT